MRRYDALQPLSREHHQALSVAARIGRCSDEDLDACWAALQAGFFPSLRDHFDEEERWLPPLLEAAPALKTQLLDDHRLLRTLMASGDEAGRRAFGRQLKAHVRFEEKQLFEWLQQRHGAQGLLRAREGVDEAG